MKAAFCVRLKELFSPALDDLVVSPPLEVVGVLLQFLLKMKSLKDIALQHLLLLLLLLLILLQVQGLLN